ncbi:hypothetical protein KR222_010453 [Zaprionus bogoriensis]|nr:hypothetical protein KR222_010453 [Zaprionus bogoriensis]
MRSHNGNTSKEFREINGNRKIKIDGRMEHSIVGAQRRKEQIQNRTRRGFSPGVEEQLDDDELQLYSDIEDMATESAEPERRVFKSVRPLLQLLSEESSPVTDSPPAAKKKALYKDVCPSSEEEDALVGRKLTSPRLNSLNRFAWTPKTTNFFLELWEKHIKDIRGSRKNSDIHKEMAQEMSEYGPSHREIKSKIDNMSRKYRLEEQKVKEGGLTTWRYFHRVKSFLAETPAVHFEEILFDNTESSSFFQSDNSDAGSAFRSSPREESVMQGPENRRIKLDHIEEQEQQLDEKSSEFRATISQMPSHAADKNTYKADRMLQIEEEKLEIERQKLQVMMHISRDLSSISKTLLEVLRNTTK